MDWKKLQEVVTSLVNTLFTTHGLTLDFKHIRHIGQKCFETSKRHIEFSVHDFSHSTEEEKVSEMSEQSDSTRTAIQFKKQMKKINESFQTYDRELEEAEKRFQELQISKLPPSIIEKLIVLLETMKDYEPDFLLNIRDISLDSWKESLNYEKILQAERKKFEGIIVKLECRYRNKTEFIKEKTAAKILRVEGELNSVKVDRECCRERLGLQVEDLRGWIRRKLDFDSENLAVIKQAGFKGIRDVIRGLKNMEKVKAKFASQLEGVNKELKSAKVKLSDCNIKLEAYKRRSEGLESELKELQNIVLGIGEKVLKVGDKKNVEIYLNEKNFSKIAEVFKEPGDNKEAVERKEESKNAKDGGNKGLGRNETEVKGLTQKKEGIAQNRTLNNGIKKSLNAVGGVSDRIGRNEKLEKQNELSENNQKLKRNSIPKNSPRPSPKPVPPKPSCPDSTFKDTINPSPPSPEIQKPMKPLKPTTEKSEALISTPKSSEKPENTFKQVQNFSSYQSSPNPPQSTNIVASTSKFNSKHRRSLDSQPLDKDSKVNHPKNKLKSSLKNIFSSEILRSTKILDSVNSSHIVSSIQSMNLEDLFALRINVNGESKTVKELALDSIQVALKQPNSSLVVDDPKVLSLKKDLSLVPNQLHRNKALKLFVLIEKYIQTTEKTGLTIENLVMQNLKNGIKDDIIDFIRNNEFPETESSNISNLINRGKKYDLLFKLYQIPKSIADDWKSDKIHVFNKIRWRNLIMKQRVKDHQFLTELAFKIEVEVRDKKQRTKNSESNSSIIKKDFHNSSMESIGLGDGRNSHKRNISLNNKGLNYFLPHIQKTPRMELIPNSFINSELWIRNR